MVPLYPTKQSNQCIRILMFPYNQTGASLVAQTVKNLPVMQQTQVQSLGQEDPLEKEMATHSSTPRESHEQRTLVGYSLWGRKESDIIE